MDSFRKKHLPICIKCIMGYLCSLKIMQLFAFAVRHYIFPTGILYFPLGRTNFPSAFQNRKCMYDIFKPAVIYEGKLNTSNSLVKRTTYFMNPCFKFLFEDWQSCVIIILNKYTQSAANAELQFKKINK
jgi:hypothetical protein